MNFNHNIPFYTNMDSGSKCSRLTKPSEYSQSRDQQESPLPKPDFSPLTQKDLSYTLKSHGSYKKQKVIYPESPMKSPIKQFYTPSKIEGRNWFGTASHKPFEVNPFRKWNFDLNEPPKSKQKLSDILDNVDEIKEEEALHSPTSKRESSNIIYKDLNFNLAFDQVNLNPKQYQMDRDFTIIKTLSESKYDNVYKCQHNQTGKIYVVKKINKSSYKSNYSTSQQLYADWSKNTSSVASKFCVKFHDFWIEEETYELVENSTHFTNKNLFLLYDYYKHGDLLDYLSKLELINYTFTPDFYWDLIFEMICGLHYFHECGYIHFDIKPANFWVDDFGFSMISDFGLCHRKNELRFLNDIMEGDSTYISPEVFNRKTVSEWDEKSDIYSLGLSILEIMAKVELPSNGTLWRELRLLNNFIIPNDFWVNWNISERDIFLKLIGKMIAPYNMRSTIKDLVFNQEFPELNKRFINWMNNSYGKSVAIPAINESMGSGNMRIRMTDNNMNINTSKENLNYEDKDDIDMCIESPR